jgi:hypothetical protein
MNINMVTAYAYTNSSSIVGVMLLKITQLEPRVPSRIYKLYFLIAWTYSPTDLLLLILLFYFCDELQLLLKHRFIFTLNLWDIISKIRYVAMFVIVDLNI